MPLFRTLLLPFLLATQISAAVISDPFGSKDADEDSLKDAADFQKLLSQIDGPALHAALHNFNPKKFKHGTFQEDQDAAVIIHHSDPVLATGMVTVAKRQSDNTTTNPVERQPSSTSVAPASTTPTTIETPSSPPTTSIVTESPTPSTVVITSTASPTPTPSSTPLSPVASPSSTPAASPSASLSSSPSREPTPTSPVSIIPSASSSSPAVVVSTPSTGPGVPTPLTTTKTSPQTSQKASPSASASSAANSNSPASTTNPPTESTPSSKGPSHTSVVLMTTTLANGRVQTITSVTIVNGPEAAETGAAATGTSKVGPSGSLQSQNAAARPVNMGWEMVTVIGGAVGFAWAL